MSDLSANTASATSPEVYNPCTPRNLLHWVFRKDGKHIHIPSHHVALQQMNRQGLQDKLGANYKIYAHEIVWHVHSLYMMRASKVIRDKIHPDGQADPTNSNFLDLSMNYHPQVVDKFINHCYMGAYQLGPEGKANKLEHVDYYPFGTDESSYPYPKSAVAFHLEMYRLAEDLDAPYLKLTLQQKLAEALLLTWDRPPEELSQYARAIFDDGYALKLTDKDKRVANILIASVLVQERKQWSDKEVKKFWTTNKRYEAFMESYREAREKTSDLHEMDPRNRHA